MRQYLVACVAALALTGAASAETRNLSGFTGVGAADRIPVEVIIGDAYRVEVLGSDAERVRTVVDDGRLEIRQRNRPLFGETRRIDARVVVTMPRVNALAASRGAEIEAEGVIAGDMSLAASMGGSIEISGSCDALNAAASMGGTIEADGFQCVTGHFSASMGGTMDVFASSSFNGSASMGGTINVAGDPETRHSSSSMGGTISSR